MARPRSWILALLLVLLAGGRAAAQEPLLDQLHRAVKSRAISLGALLQLVGDYQHERSSGSTGFRVTNFWLNLGGELDGRFGYFLQANLTASRPILDAVLRYRLGAAATVEAGQFKAPFSRELLIASSQLEFVERSRVVDNLAPGRQVGFQVRGQLSGGRVTWGAGAFNGNGMGASNDNDRLLYAGRLAVWPVGADPAAKERLEIAVNAASSEDAAVALGSLVPAFQGTRTLVGGDLRWVRAPWLVSGEIIRARLALAAGPVARPLGWQATLGYDVTPRTQVLVRWDGWRPDGLAPDSDLLIAGVGYSPTGAVRLRLNYAVDVAHAALARNRVLAGAQLVF